MASKKTGSGSGAGPGGAGGGSAGAGGPPKPSNVTPIGAGKKAGKGAATAPPNASKPPAAKRPTELDAMGDLMSEAVDQVMAAQSQQEIEKANRRKAFRLGFCPEWKGKQLLVLLATGAESCRTAAAALEKQAPEMAAVEAQIQAELMNRLVKQREAQQKQVKKQQEVMRKAQEAARKASPGVMSGVDQMREVRRMAEEQFLERPLKDGDVVDAEFQEEVPDAGQVYGYPPGNRVWPRGRQVPANFGGGDCGAGCGPCGQVRAVAGIGWDGNMVLDGKGKRMPRVRAMPMRETGPGAPVMIGLGEQYRAIAKALRERADYLEYLGAGVTPSDRHRMTEAQAEEFHVLVSAGDVTGLAAVAEIGPEMARMIVKMGEERDRLAKGGDLVEPLYVSGA